MADLVDIYAASGREIIGDDSTPTLTLTSAATVGAALQLRKTVIGTASTATFVLPVASVASGPAIQLAGTAFVSVTTIKATTGGVAGTGAIRVRLTDNTFGWIPVYPDGAVTAAVWE